MDIGNIGMMLLVIIGGCTGLLTTVVITLGIPIVVIWKSSAALQRVFRSQNRGVLPL